MWPIRVYAGRAASHVNQGLHSPKKMLEVPGSADLFRRRAPFTPRLVGAIRNRFAHSDLREQRFERPGMNSNELTDSDENDSLVLISPRRRIAAGKKPSHGVNKHHEKLTSSLYSFTYSQNTGMLLKTRLSAMQRSAATVGSTYTSPTLQTILKLLQFLQQPAPPISLPTPTESGSSKVADSHSDPDSIDGSILRFLTLPYTDVVKPGDHEPVLSPQRPPSMFRRASSMIITPSDSVVQGISTPLEHLPSKFMHAQAVLTTEASYPFGIRTLNDIACLVCVTNQQTAPNRTILDFVAPQFREWLTSRINEDPSARVRLSGELVDFLIMDKPKMVSLWVEYVSGDSLVWTIQEVGVCSTGDSDTVDAAGPSTLESPKQISEPTMRHRIDGDHQVVLSSPLGFREPHVIACAVAIDRLSLQICGYNRPTLYFMLGYKGEDLVGKPVTDLLPQFQQFWSAVEPLCNNIGVVIPEHKFRELAGIDVSSPAFVDPHPSCDPERSIRANGKAGTFTYVDIQLRLVDGKSLVLWISYSRACEQVAPDNSMLNVPSQRTLLPTVLTTLDSTSSSSPSPTVSSSGERASDPESSDDHKTSPQSPSLENEHLVPEESVFDSSKKHGDTESQTIQVHKVAAADVKSSFSAHGTQTPPPDVATNVKLLPDDLRSKSAGPSDDEVWAELSKIEVGAQRRSKNLKDYEVLKVLGEGAYGRVTLVRPKAATNVVLAFKSIFKDRILVDTWSRDRKLGTIPNEIRILNQLRATRHPHIVQMVDYFEDKDCYHIEMLPIGNPQGVDLFDFLEAQSANTNQRELLGIWGQVVSAVAHIHSLGIVHRDIKDENIVMDGKGNAKLIDFGSAAYLKQGPFDVFVGTVDYAAPEIVRGQTYEGCPQDSWALGILLYTIMYKETPFHGIEAIIKGNLRSDLNCQGSSLIRRLLVKSPAGRPTAARCLEYLKEMDMKID